MEYQQKAKVLDHQGQSLRPSLPVHIAQGYRSEKEPFGPHQ